MLLFRVEVKYLSIFNPHFTTMNDTSPILPSRRLLDYAIQDIKQSTTSVELLHSLGELLRSQHHDLLPIFLSATPFLVLALLTLLTYKLLIYPIFLSPLSLIPSAHPLAAITPLWMDYRRLTGKEVSTTHAAFQKYGPFVRLGPNEVAVNTITGGVTAAHGHGFQNLDKTSWYDFFINHRYVACDLLSTSTESAPAPATPSPPSEKNTATSASASQTSTQSPTSRTRATCAP